MKQVWISAVSMISFVLLSIMIIKNETDKFDNTLIEFIYSNRTPFITSIMNYLTEIGHPIVVIMTVGCLGTLLLYKKMWTELTVLAVTIILI